MKQSITVAQLNLTVLVLAVLVFAGCGKASFTSTYSSSSSTDLNINGHRTITKIHDGITRRLESATDIEFQDGHITKFSKGAVVQLEETGGPDQRQAELREYEGKLELWVKENGAFRKGSSVEE